MEPISFINRIDFKDSLKLSFGRYYQSGKFCLTIILSIVMILCYWGDGIVIAMIGPIILLSLPPIIIYFRTKKRFADKPVNESETQWLISQSGIKFEQGSMSVETGWDKIYKISETKNWITIWMYKKPVFYLKKSYLTSDQYDGFRKIARKMNKGFRK